MHEVMRLKDSDILENIQAIFLFNINSNPKKLQVLQIFIVKAYFYQSTKFMLKF